MRRAWWNFHECTVGTLLLVVVFLAATSAGSPRSFDSSNSFQGRSIYPRTISMPRYRTISESEKDTNDVHKNADKEHKPLSDIKDQSQESDAEAVEGQKKFKTDSATCASKLMKKHPEMCDAVTEIFNFSSLFPEVRGMVTRRMGQRKLNFVCLATRRESVVGQLYEAVKCFGNTIKNLLRFLGSSTELKETTSSTTANPTVSQINETHPHQETNRSSYRRNRKRQWKDHVDENEEAKLLVNRMNNVRSPENCLRMMLEVDNDVCGTLAKMEVLHRIMKNSHNRIFNDEVYHDYEMPIKLSSDDLFLGNFLEAIRKSFLEYGSTTIYAKEIEEAWKNVDNQDKSTSPGRRSMVNENDEEIAEIFQTSDFRIEFVPQNDHPSFRNTFGPRNEHNLMDNRNEKTVARRIPTVNYRSGGFNGENAKEWTGRKMQRLSATSRRAEVRLPEKNVEKKMRTPWSAHSWRSLGKDLTSRSTEREQGRFEKSSEDHRRGHYQDPYRPADTITSTKNYPQYRDSDPATANLDGSSNKEKCVCGEDYRKTLDCTEWLFSKVREFSKKAFGSEK